MLTLREKLMANDDMILAKGIHSLTVLEIRYCTGELYDKSIHSQNDLEQVKRVEVFRVSRTTMDTHAQCNLHGTSLHDHDESRFKIKERDNNTTITSVESTKETDRRTKWWIVFKVDKETKATTCVEKSHFHSSRGEPMIYSRLQHRWKARLRPGPT
jgi:hypothetical protein